MALPTPARLVAFVGTSDMAEAKKFYCDRLGLKAVSEDGFALVLDVHGVMLRVAMVGKVTPAVYTVLGWEVPDISAAVKDLEASGIALERFAGMGQDEAGIWTAPGGGARVAWFRDPDGNGLSVSQHSSV